MYRTKFDFSWYSRKASRQIGQFTLISTLLLSSGAMYASGRTLATLNPNPNVSISINHGTMRSAIEKIEKSSGYVFVYNDDVRAYLGRHVSMRVKNQNIDEVMGSMLEGTNLSYRRSGRQITIYTNANAPRSTTNETSRTSSPLPLHRVQNQALPSIERYFRCCAMSFGTQNRNPHSLHISRIFSCGIFVLMRNC